MSVSEIIWFFDKVFDESRLNHFGTINYGKYRGAAEPAGVEIFSLPYLEAYNMNSIVMNFQKILFRPNLSLTRKEDVYFKS